MTVIYHHFLCLSNLSQTLFRFALRWHGKCSHGGGESPARLQEKKERQSLIKNMKPTVSEFPECFFEIDDVFRKEKKKNYSMAEIMELLNVVSTETLSVPQVQREKA